MIVSELYNGKIYAGETPLESTIVVEQTGPLQLTVRSGGHLQTTGRARIVKGSDLTRAQIEELDKGSNLGERIGETDRFRLWLSGKRKKRHQVIEDYVWNIPIPGEPTQFFLYIGTSPGGSTDFYVGALPASIPVILPAGQATVNPPGWSDWQTIIFPFTLYPEDTQLPNITILTVEPGFPLAT